VNDFPESRLPELLEDERRRFPAIPEIVASLGEARARRGHPASA